MIDAREKPVPNLKSGQYQIDVQADAAFSTQIDEAAIAEAIQTTLRQQGVEDAAVAVLITDDESIRALNQRYRGVDAPTDVLSFPQQVEGDLDLASSALPEDLAQELRRYLGDLVIAFPYSQGQADRYRSSVDAELRLLAVHGTLHLLGYDHGTDEEKAAMWAAQDVVLATLGEQPFQDRTYE